MLRGRGDEIQPSSANKGRCKTKYLLLSPAIGSRAVQQLIAIIWSEEKTTNESLQKIDFSNE